MITPDGKPATFNGQAWVSEDGRYRWNGAAWQPVARRRGPNLFVAGTAALIGLAVVLVVTGVIRPTPSAKTTSLQVTIGVTNAKIDSRSRVEFDYASKTHCTQVVFQIVFYDAAGHDVGEYIGSEGELRPGVEHHFVFDTNTPIPATATHFSVAPDSHS